jgi:hypothetical protein
MFQFTVIPGAAERRPGIQSAAETLWIPAFAGMTEKNSITKIQTVKKPPVSSVFYDQPDGRGNCGLFVTEKPEPIEIVGLPYQHMSLSGDTCSMFYPQDL